MNNDTIQILTKYSQSITGTTTYKKIIIDISLEVLTIRNIKRLYKKIFNVI